MKPRRDIRSVYDHLCRIAPPSLAEEWDSVGLQVGNLSDTLQGILVSLDVTETALWETVEHDCNLLITHHPLFLKPLRRLDDAIPASRCARLAAQTGVHVLSFHTNLDSTPRGLNDQLAERLGLQGLKPLFPSRDRRWPKAGLGRVGTVAKTTLARLLEKIGQRLRLKNLRFVGDLRHPIRKVAVMTGSGGSSFVEAKACGADCLITGDVKYHQALDALAACIALIDIGHFAGEIGMVPWLAENLRRFARTKRWRIKVLESRLSSDPFQFWSGRK